VSLVTERRESRPWGLAGGGPGLPGENWFLPDGDEARAQRLPAKVTIGPGMWSDPDPGRRRMGRAHRVTSRIPEPGTRYTASLAVAVERGNGAQVHRARARARLASMNVNRTLQRAFGRFLEDPASTRIAAMLIGAATITAVVVGGVAMRLLDHREYPTLGRAFWFTLQTVTTVGYGDVTPTTVIGRVVATAVMLTGIGFLTITTAAITSMFVEASRRRLAAPVVDATGAMVEDRARDLQALTARLDQIDEKLAALVEQTRP
jgi:hypothetical protein